MELNQIIDKAREHGFTLAAPLEVSTISLMPEVRDMCAACEAYGKKWSCPPGCGTLEECGDKLRRYQNGIIVQTTAELEDDFDAEGMMEAAKRHGENFSSFTKYLRSELGDIFPLGAGGCRLCSECTYPDEPCRLPELMTSSMESFGMLISDVCKKNSVPYNHGRGTLTYVGCYLFNPREGIA